MNLILSILARFFVLYSGLLASLGGMAYFGQPTAAFFYRLLASYSMLVVCALYGVVASIALRIVGLHRISQWATARAFKYTMWLAIGVEFEIISGQEHLNTRPTVFVGNHQTALDVLLLGAIFPRYCSVTAKKQLKAMPFLGWFMALSGTVFIDRGNRSTARKAFEGAAQEIKQKKQSVFIFPEGTRSNAERPELLPFKKGAFHLAIQAGVPIVPVISACYTGLLSSKSWRFRGGTIPTVVLPPIPTTGLTADDVDELTNYTRDVMMKALVSLTDSSYGHLSYKPVAPELSSPTQARAQAIKAVQGIVVEGDLRKRLAAKKPKENGLAN